VKGRVYVFGAGKVGRALAAAAKRTGLRIGCRPAREGWPQRRVDASLVILAVRDPLIEASAEQMVTAGCVPTTAAIVHCAGALGPEVLAPARRAGHAVAQMHPLLAFASSRKPPRLDGAAVHLRGDRVAVQRARRFSKGLGMRPLALEGMDLTLYHAAAALLANGAVGLAAAAEELLRAAHAPADASGALLGPLLRSVADNLEGLGLPEALTGPVRRGDTAAVMRHRERLTVERPELVALYDRVVAAQVALSRALGEARAEDLDAIDSAVQGKIERA
jgi:predicted short-subunit dehydrogenase-like oxidoreductase (DUF2520 family)